MKTRVTKYNLGTKCLTLRALLPSIRYFFNSIVVSFQALKQAITKKSETVLEPLGKEKK